MPSRNTSPPVGPPAPLLADSAPELSWRPANGGCPGDSVAPLSLWRGLAGIRTVIPGALARGAAVFIGGGSFRRGGIGITRSCDPMRGVAGGANPENSTARDAAGNNADRSAAGSNGTPAIEGGDTAGRNRGETGALVRSFGAIAANDTIVAGLPAADVAARPRCGAEVDTTARGEGIASRIAFGEVGSRADTGERGGRPRGSVTEATTAGGTRGTAARRTGTTAMAARRASPPKCSSPVCVAEIARSAAAKSRPITAKPGEAPFSSNVRMPII
jgi:hypothetical protein